MNDLKHILWFEEVGKHDTPIVGGKGANLGEMVQAGIPIPYGFVVTVASYRYFIEANSLQHRISNHLKTIDFKDPNSLQRVSAIIKKEVIESTVPDDLAKEIIAYYYELPKRAMAKHKKDVPLHTKLSEPLVAVRSSATAEDLPSASFAGQQATFLDIKGEANVVQKVKEAWASLFEARAIFYRHEQNIAFSKVGIAVPVQLMVRSHASGVMFTVDPLTNNKNKIVVEAIYGLGEYIVQGVVTPDHFEVDKHTWEISNVKIETQTKMLVKGEHDVRQEHIPHDKATKQKITNEQVVEVAKIGAQIEKHYFFPQDIEWAIDQGIVYIVQSRPITTMKAVQKENDREEIAKDGDNTPKEILVTGNPASPGIASGIVKVLASAKEIDKINKGDILVTEQTNPDFVPAMKKASAIVTEKGGRTSHAAIVSRELGIPAVVGAEHATKVLTLGMVVTVNGAKGEVYRGASVSPNADGKHAATAQTTEEAHLKTATKVYVNLATPDRVAEISKMNVDGIGLLRAEFMIADIGIHPKKLIKDKKEHVFIDSLSKKLTTFAEAFNPRPVVYRATDFKTNEYRNLIGGKEFEPEEANPMLGYRGCYRYIADPAVFELELEAIKVVRNKHRLKNLHLMIPFVRTVNELIEVKKIIAASGLSRSSDFKLWMMVEIPSNVILLDKFCEVGIDGVSIGSNDLTMLILGTDRDNHEVAKEFDERNEAVLWALKHVITTCHKYKITCSICGQAPSDYPDLVEKLVNWGITSVSVNPDAITHTRQVVSHFEKRLVASKGK